MIVRTTPPDINNKYYITRAYGGYSTCKEGNENNQPYFCKPRPGSVLPNCVGYALGRFSEISDLKANAYWNLNTNAGLIFDRAKSLGYLTGQTPVEGALMIWHNSDCGHVAVVEKVNYYYAENGRIIGSVNISQSGWSMKTKTGLLFATHYFDSSVRGYNGNKGDRDWLSGESWYNGHYDKFLGFVYNPAITNNLPANYLDSDLASAAGPDYTISKDSNAVYSYNTGSKKYSPLEMYNQSLEKERQNIIDFSNNRGINLLTSANMVETPFIIATIGGYTFGSFTREGTIANNSAGMTVTYPNYMNRIEIDKTNGQVNTYTLTMDYQIRAGDDPNLLDKIFSTAKLSGTIKLTYGDWSSPSFIYKEEEAIITKITSNLDFSSQKITYTLSCQSKALKAAAVKHDFPGCYKKGSDVIKSLLKNKQYGLSDVFQGMSNAAVVANNNWIMADDKEVKIEAQSDIDVISYLNYVVGCMSPITDNTNNAGLKDSTYHLVIMDDTNNEYGGGYFKVVKIGTSTKELVSADMYEVDIGFPTNTYVTSFNINENDSWSILYDYSNEFSYDQYKYTIANDGTLRAEMINRAESVNKHTEYDKTWWTNTTKHPIKATLTIKGLLRPAILMSYVRINTYFYGQKHNSSGIYAITKQKDSIDSTGYRTELSLIRIAGDD